MAFSPDADPPQGVHPGFELTKVNSDTAQQVASEMGIWTTGGIVPGWIIEPEIETTFIMSPDEFLARVPDTQREIINRQRHLVDIILKRDSPSNPNLHIKGRIRLDAAAGYVPEIGVKIKGKVGSIKIATEYVRQRGCQDLDQLVRQLTADGWIRELPDRERERVSYRLHYNGRTAKIAFSRFTPRSTHFFTQMPWEADLEAAQEDMYHFTQLIGIPDEWLTSQSFAQRERSWINRRSTSAL
jgi:hypothetical protein